MNQIWIAENTYRGKNSMLKKLVNFRVFFNFRQPRKSSHKNCLCFSDDKWYSEYPTCVVWVLQPVTVDISAAEDHVAVQTQPVLPAVPAVSTGSPHVHRLRPVRGKTLQVGTPGQRVDSKPPGHHQGGEAHISSCGSSTSTGTSTATGTSLISHFLFTC